VPLDMLIMPSLMAHRDAPKKTPGMRQCFNTDILLEQASATAHGS